MSTTTFEAIRDAQARAIELLTPTNISGDKFRRHRDAKEFMPWVAATPTSCFRRFQILSNFDDVQEPTADGGVEGCRHTMELRVAYPLQYGKFGRENAPDMEDLMRLDLALIDKTIGLNGAAIYTAGQHLCQKQAQAIDDSIENARVMSVTYLVLYDRSV